MGRMLKTGWQENIKVEKTDVKVAKQSPHKCVKLKMVQDFFLVHRLECSLAAVCSVLPQFGAFFPIFIQKRGLSSWEHHLLISRSDFVMLSLKTLPSHSNSPCFHLALLCFCSNCMLALRYIVAYTDFLHSSFSTSPHTQAASLHSSNICSQISTLLLDFLCNNPVKILCYTDMIPASRDVFTTFTICETFLIEQILTQQW